MTDQQLYFAVGVPVFAVLMGILTNIIVVGWNARSIEKLLVSEIKGVNAKIDGVDSKLDAKIDGLRNEMNAQFIAVHEQIHRVEQVMDTRIKHLEEHRR